MTSSIMEMQPKTEPVAALNSTNTSTNTWLSLVRQQPVKNYPIKLQHKLIKILTEILDE